MRVQPEISIKDRVLENFGKQKPRFLFTDGDKGQCAADFVIKVFSDCWFKWRDGHHIKHLSKPEAVRRVSIWRNATGSKIVGDDT